MRGASGYAEISPYLEQGDSGVISYVGPEMSSIAA